MRYARRAFPMPSAKATTQGPEGGQGAREAREFGKEWRVHERGTRRLVDWNVTAMETGWKGRAATAEVRCLVSILRGVHWAIAAADYFGRRLFARPEIEAYCGWSTTRGSSGGVAWQADHLA